MCPPLYYRQRPEEREQALSEWRRLYRLLRDGLSVDVDLLEPRPDLPGLTHVGSGGCVVGDTFIVSRFSNGARELECEPLENFFLVRGYEIKHLEMKVRFEGNQDIIACNGTLFTGCHLGDANRMQEEIQAMLDSEVVALELADDWRRPIASCLCPVENDQALFCPTAFTKNGREKLESHIPRLTPVDGEDSGVIICNSLIVGKDVVVAQSHSVVRPTLERLDLTVHELPLGEVSGDGGPRALTLRID